YMRFLIPRQKRVLELGCGRGDLLATLEPSPGVGVDFSPGAIERARSQYPHLNFIVGDVEDADTRHAAPVREVVGHQVLLSLVLGSGQLPDG
ncbi:class I SAM-dependent methyltransferase, partial [Streptomyces sp. P17]|uniref:class I SAM-dependent methyltransferase n=1 Tax=Streptomyces sp. P17 TaxID=3074716 RepID=UPI0028F44866